MPRKAHLLPEFLQGIVSQTVYSTWLYGKSVEQFNLDKLRHKPFATPGARPVYMEKIHELVCRHVTEDPYTGETLRWDLIGNYHPEKVKTDPGYFRRFYLMPSFDHIDPNSTMLELEICSMLVNECKTSLTGDEFVEMCGKVAEGRRLKRRNPSNK